ncbi:MAG: peptidoglycan-binding domain-containing protein, partial [Pseudomonadota bacterium]
AERKQLQRALADRGFDPGPVDGIIGAGTKRALRRWQMHNRRLVTQR